MADRTIDYQTEVLEDVVAANGTPGEIRFLAKNHAHLIDREVELTGSAAWLFRNTESGEPYAVAANTPFRVVLTGLRSQSIWVAGDGADSTLDILVAR